MGGAVGNIVSGIGDAVGGAVQGVSDAIHDVGESPIVQTVLPIVATAVGGPAAGAAVTGAMSLDQGQSLGTALGKSALTYGISQGINSLMTPSTPLDVEYLDSLSGIEQQSLSDAISQGASGLSSWVAANPLTAAGLGLTVGGALSGAFKPQTVNGVTYTPVNWNYLAPQFNTSASNITPSTYQMPQTMQQGLQRNVQLGQGQIIDPTVLAAQNILNQPRSYYSPKYEPLISGSPAVTNLTQPIQQAQPVIAESGGLGSKGGANTIQPALAKTAQSIESGLKNLFGMF